MCYISQLYAEYDAEFTNTWSDDLTEDDALNSFNVITQFIERSFVLLCKSVLTGEYISLVTYRDEVNRFKNRFATTDFSTDAPDSTITKVMILYNKMNQALNKCLDCCIFLHDISKESYSLDESLSEVSKFRITNISYSAELQYLRFFIQDVMRLCNFERSLNRASANIGDIFDIRIDIQDLYDKVHLNGNSSLKSILNILLCKCNYLIKKVRSTPFSIYLDLQTEKVAPDVLDLGILSYFFDERLPEYLSPNSVNALRYKVFNTDVKNQGMVSDIVTLMMYEQKNSNEFTLDRMQRTLDLYENNHTALITNTTDYDKFAYESVRLFLHNCVFSVKAKLDDFPFDDLKTEIDNIEKLQTKGIKNFHPYEKVIESVSRKIAHILNKESRENANDDFSRISAKLSLLELYIEKFEEALRWCRERDYVPFILPHSESSVECKSLGINVFVSSSFARKINYDKLKLNLSKYRQDLITFKSRLEVRKEIFGISEIQRTLKTEIEEDVHSRLEEVTELQKELRDDAKTNERKTYELVGAFAAIVTFLFGVVSIFSTNTDKEKPFMYLVENTFALGVLLLLFLSVLFLSSPYFVERCKFKEMIKTPRFWILIIMISIEIGFLISTVLKFD